MSNATKAGKQDMCAGAKRAFGSSHLSFGWHPHCVTGGETSPTFQPSWPSPFAQVTMTVVAMEAAMTRAAAARAAARAAAAVRAAAARVARAAAAARLPAQRRPRGRWLRQLLPGATLRSRLGSCLPTVLVEGASLVRERSRAEPTRCLRLRLGFYNVLGRLSMSYVRDWRGWLADVGVGALMNAGSPVQSQKRRGQWRSDSWPCRALQSRLGRRSARPPPLLQSQSASWPRRYLPSLPDRLSALPYPRRTCRYNRTRM